MYAIFGALSLSEVLSSLTYSRWDTAVLIYFILALGRCVPSNNFFLIFSFYYLLAYIS